MDRAVLPADGAPPRTGHAGERIAGIEDVTPLAAGSHVLVRDGEPGRAAGLLPEERPTPLDDDVLARLRA
ncbi:hypothetical protein ADK41_21100 [Streptomyces caelestis]|uniref:Uncharacterized protein n=1 Tax=Streptomyces caelestis TaxID=36816 RepID=A0A0M9X7S4_9ACTN|nr:MULTISPECIES: hypothetical protein [Streptomyces]KOT37087.1 hypothetical protein ADK41_21100 [Streptomyces caelestis]KOV23053.1 hypothetical protein ADK58_26050 [Streptomyces sp. XY152]